MITYTLRFPKMYSFNTLHKNQNQNIVNWTKRGKHANSTLRIELASVLCFGVNSALYKVAMSHELDIIEQLCTYMTDSNEIFWS